MSNINILIPSLGDKYVDDRNRVWGDSYNWDFDRSTTDVKYVVVHHSVTVQTGTWQNQVDQIASIHQARGWGGIGYHFVVCSDGTVAYVGDLGQARANVANKNEQVIGICFVGDFTKVLPTDAQIHSGHTLINFLLGLASYPNIKTWESVVGHQELQATACPGPIWKAPADSFYWRLMNDKQYSPEPTTTTTTTSTTSTTSSSTSSSTTLTTATETPDPCVGEAALRDVLRGIALSINGRGFWWTKYSKIKTIIKESEALWK